MLRDLLEATGWEVVHTRRLPERPPAYVNPADLGLSGPASRLLATAANGIYGHQHEALGAFKAGEHVCLATGTASGKSLAFMAAGVETLARDPSARVMAIYPLRALAREQEERWRRALEAAGLPDSVGRIDGSVREGREAILRRCRLLLCTPDVVHAWLLGSLSSRAVRSFLAGLRLVVVDEVHVYSGVFGSNAAFLFRRLRHAAVTCAGRDRLRFLAASATVASPQEHLEKLFGLPFRVIGEGADTSPRFARLLLMARPPGLRDLYTEIPELLAEIVSRTRVRFLAFVDSRRQTEQLATILSRRGNPDPEAAAARATDLSVLPYRSGYEEEDRALIQERLASGHLRGVISTSALELGLDIPDLDAALLIGVPQTGTSLQQRIGRVGRHRPGEIVIIDAGGIADAVVFDSPETVLERPLAPTALYLDNRRIQYIHALCFAGAGGEYDTLQGAGPESAGEPAIVTPVGWPQGFLDLCAAERSGNVPPDLLSLKADAGDDPWHAFPLRDVGTQYRVELPGENMQRLGSLSHAQLMREAYPGAVYYYMTTPYRVVRLFQREKKVIVRRERQYTTSPSGPPVLVAPQLEESRVHRGLAFGDLKLVECDMYVSEVITGFTEQRGPTREPRRYPNEFWPRDRFTRNYTTTGVLISHPALNRPEVDLQALSALLLESFLLAAPFERTDVSAGAGKHLLDRMGFVKGERYVTVYDQTYGSLRLSGHLMEPETLRTTLSEALAILETDRLEGFEAGEAVGVVLAEILECARRRPEELPTWLHGGGMTPDQAGGGREVVILPGSVGWIITEDNQEFAVERVYYHPTLGLCYRGRKVGVRLDPSVEVSFPVKNVRPVTGISQVGVYDYETGEVTPIE